MPENIVFSDALEEQSKTEWRIGAVVLGIVFVAVGVIGYYVSTGKYIEILSLLTLTVGIGMFTWIVLGKLKR